MCEHRDEACWLLLPDLMMINLEGHQKTVVSSINYHVLGR